MNEVDDYPATVGNEEWGTWECPVCGETHEDPAYTTITSCRRCETAVFLSAMDNNNRFTAFAAELVEVS